MPCEAQVSETAFIFFSSLTFCPSISAVGMPALDLDLSGNIIADHGLSEAMLPLDTYYFSLLTTVTPETPPPDPQRRDSSMRMPETTSPSRDSELSSRISLGVTRNAPLSSALCTHRFPVPYLLTLVSLSIHRTLYAGSEILPLVNRFRNRPTSSRPTKEATQGFCLNPPRTLTSHLPPLSFRN